MPTITDRFGTWNQLGSVTPQAYNQWFYLGEEHVVSSGSYRLTFTSNNFSGIRSFAWLRAIYNSGNEIIVSRAIRVYPKTTPLFIDFPIPQSLIALGVGTQRLELKKLVKRWRSDWMWSVKAEELVLDKNSQNTFTLLLDNPSYSQDPSNPDLWITTFTQYVAYQTFEVGRFFDAKTNQIVSDPVILEATSYKLVCAFTSKEIVQPDQYKVRIIY